MINSNQVAYLLSHHECSSIVLLRTKYLYFLLLLSKQTCYFRFYAFERSSYFTLLMILNMILNISPNGGNNNTYSPIDIAITGVYCT